jgi:hypothetical protein
MSGLSILHLQRNSLPKNAEGSGNRFTQKNIQMNKIIKITDVID